MKPNFNNILDLHMDKILLTLTAFFSFIASYFMDLTLNNYEQFLAVILVVLLDGYFGVIAGIKREGFKTYKAIKILRSIVTWVVILAVLLSVENGFKGSGWLSETVMIPFIIFQVISALKNASMAGYIKNDVLNNILDRIDNHKGKRS